MESEVADGTLPPLTALLDMTVHRADRIPQSIPGQKDHSCRSQAKLATPQTSLSLFGSLLCSALTGPLSWYTMDSCP